MSIGSYVLVCSCIYYCVVNWLIVSDHTPYKASCRESSPTSRCEVAEQPLSSRYELLVSSVTYNIINNYDYDYIIY